MYRLYLRIREILAEVVETATSREKLRHHISDPLYQNAYYLMGNTVVLAILGLGFGFVITSCYTDEEVGLGMGIIQAMTLLAALSSLGLGFGLIRFLPSAGERANRMINSCLTIVTLTAIAAILIFLAVLPLWLPNLLFIRQNPIVLSCFIIFTLVWALSTLADQLFIAERSAKFTFIKNTLASTSKIPFALLFALWFGFDAFGILAASGLTMFLAVFVAFAFFLPAIRRGYKLRPDLQLDSIGHIASYSLENYVAGLLWTTPVLLFPLIVLSILGAEAHAHFYVAWMIGAVLFMIPGALAASLFAEGSYEEDMLLPNVWRSLKVSMLILIPAIMLIFTFGDKMLLVFGQSYSENATTLLWLLALSAIPMGINNIYLSMQRVKKNMSKVLLISALGTCLTLGLSYPLMITLDLAGVGLGWLLGHTLVTLLIIPTLLHRDVILRRWTKLEVAVPGSTATANASGIKSIACNPYQIQDSLKKVLGKAARDYIWPFLARVWANLDRLLATLGLIASIILTIWLSMNVGKYMEVAVMLFLASGTYLVIRHRQSTSDKSLLSPTRARSSVYLALNIVFFFLFALSMLSIALRSELYIRPTGYFVLTSLIAATLAALIFLAPPKKLHTLMLMLQIMLLGLSLRLTPQLLFPGLIGVDPWWHQMFTAGILESGYIPTEFAYSRLPIMHLVISANSLVSNLDYDLSTILSLALAQIVVFTLFTFLIGKLLGAPKVGLLGGLILMVAPGTIGHGFCVTPTALGMILVLVTIYILFRTKKRGGPPFLAGLSILLMFTLILSHTVSALCMAILFFCFWAGLEIHSRMDQRIFRVPSSGYLFTSVMFTVGMFSWWMYASGHMTFLAELIDWGFHVDPWAASSAAVEYGGQVTYGNYLLNQLGFLLFYVFGIIGALYMLSTASRSNHSFAIVVGGGILTAIAFFSMPLGLSGILAHRWFYYSQLVLAFPAAFGVVLLCSLCRTKRTAAIILASVAFAVSFFMITNSMTNFDNPTYAKDLTPRCAFTAAELQGMNAISDMCEGKAAVIYPDNYYFRCSEETPVEELGLSLWAKDFSNCRDSLVTIRNEIVTHPFSTEGGILKLDYDPRDLLEEQGFSQVYSSSSVSGFVFTGEYEVA